MQINHITNYAIKAIIYLATVGRSVSSQEIADEIMVSRSLLINILGKLRAKKIINAERGLRGGYSLARDPSEISLFDVIQCMEKTIYINYCLEPGTMSNMVSDPNFRNVHQYFYELQEGLEESLRAMTLDKLITKQSSWTKSIVRSEGE